MNSDPLIEIFPPPIEQYLHYITTHIDKLHDHEHQNYKMNAHSTPFSILMTNNLKVNE